MDRLDYLLRDARAAGVPYGEIDLNYLLNNIKISPNGVLGFDEKALTAAEHFLLARVFMHRVVYYHKTTFGFEEACRQLLRRVRDCERYNDILANDGQRIQDICGTSELRGFTDDYIDRIIFKTSEDKDDVIRILATCLLERRPPRLLAEIAGIENKDGNFTAGSVFKQNCRNGLEALAQKHDLKLGQFLLCGPKPIKFEERGSLFSRANAEKLEPQEREELIMVFRRGKPEPESIVEFKGSIIHNLSNQVFSIQRLYLAELDLPPAKLELIRKEVRKWDARYSD